MRRSTYVEFIKIGFTLLWFFFCDLLWFFKDLVKIKNKRKGEKPLSRHPQTAQGGYVNGFVSPKRLDVRFYCPRRKSKFGSKLRKAKRTFSFWFQLPPPASFRGPISHQLAGSLHPFSLSPLPAGASRHLGVVLAGGAIGYGRFPTPAHGGALSGVHAGQHWATCRFWCMFQMYVPRL